MGHGIALELGIKNALYSMLSLETTDSISIIVVRLN